MRNRLISALLSFCMLLAAIATVSASYSDIEGHWGKDYIEEATALGLFGGISATEFAPNGTMTRGMFVTVLGRLEGIDPDAWSDAAMPVIFTDVASGAYYTPYVAWAVCNGIVDGMSPTTFEPNTPVTREQTAKLVAYYAQKLEHVLNPVTGASVPDGFADADRISAWAADSVDLLRSLGILNGMEQADGTVCFQPQNTLTRAECAAIFCRLSKALVRSEYEVSLPHILTLSDNAVILYVDRAYQLTANILPDSARQTPLVWRSSNPNVVTVDGTGKVTCVGTGKATVSVYAVNGLYSSCEFTCRKISDASNDEIYNAKCLRIFGEIVDDPRMYYAIYDENGNYIDMDYEWAAAQMVSVTVRVWDFDSSGEKVTKTMTVQVHRNLAATVEAIFEEIYNGEERFPIHYLGGFSYGGRSEHTIGCAIDINPEENYYYNPNTGETVGSHWKPGEDPYSIPLDGEVVRIFEKYGFRQGAYWNNGTKDYMHFSYFGT
ncbi:MAG: S-layer homology domain-containing protein [Faecousia sp.]